MRTVSHLNSVYCQPGMGRDSGIEGVGWGRGVAELTSVTVRLGERGRNPDGSFLVRVSFGESAEYDVTVD